MPFKYIIYKLLKQINLWFVDWPFDKQDIPMNKIRFLGDDIRINGNWKNLNWMNFEQDLTYNNINTLSISNLHLKKWFKLPIYCKNIFRIVPPIPFG